MDELIINFLIWLVSVSAIVGFILALKPKINNAISNNSVVAKTLDEAQNADGYWPGKEGKSFTQAEKQAAFERARKKSRILFAVNKDYARCERNSCRAWTFYGNADKKGEHLRALMLGYIRGVGGHRVPKAYGGGREKLGAIWLCDNCNSKESDEINDYVLAEVKREGKKIFVG